MIKHAPKFKLKFCYISIVADWARPDEFGPAYRGQIGVQLKVAYWLFWIGKKGPSGSPRCQFPVGGDAFSVAVRLDTKRIKYRASFCVNINGWFKGVPLRSQRV